MTVDTFGDFDLEWDWRVEPAGNNGIKYFITEERGSAIGHEYQMIDDVGPSRRPRAPSAPPLLSMSHCRPMRRSR
jgi:hypothetical protein